MVTVPAAMPFTTPMVLMVAMAVLLVFHVPPDGVAVTVAIEPAQVLVLPEMGEIDVVTVTSAVA
jgi:hypothetical protein